MKCPACFDSEDQWQAWCAASEQSGAQISKDRYCVDCLPGYRDEMSAESRCAFPETVFVIEHGSVVGIQVSDRGWFGAVTGVYSGSGKKSSRKVVAMGSPIAVINELRRRKQG